MLRKGYVRLGSHWVRLGLLGLVRQSYAKKRLC